MIIRVLDYMYDEFSEIEEEELFENLVADDDSKTGEQYWKEVKASSITGVSSIPDLSKIDKYVFGFIEGNNTTIVRTLDGDGYIIEWRGNGRKDECRVFREDMGWSPYGEKSMHRGKLYYPPNYSNDDDEDE